MPRVLPVATQTVSNVIAANETHLLKNAIENVMPAAAVKNVIENAT